MDYRFYREQLELWLLHEHPDVFARVSGESRTRGFRNHEQGERVAVTVIQSLLGRYGRSAPEALYEDDLARFPEGTLWEYALAWLCSKQSLSRYVRNEPTLHRSVRRQESVGLRLAHFARQRGRELLEAVGERYEAGQLDLPAVVRQLTLQLYLEGPVETAQDRPSLEEIDRAFQQGIVGLKAVTLLKLADYGRGLRPEELQLAQTWLGSQPRSADRVHLEVLAGAAGYRSREVLTAALARWRRQIRTGESQRNRSRKNSGG